MSAMRKRTKVTYLVLLDVGAIEDHLTRPRGGSRERREPAAPVHTRTITMDRRKGGLAR